MSTNIPLKMSIFSNERLIIFQFRNNRHYLSLLRLTGCVFYIVNSVIFQNKLRLENTIALLVEIRLMNEMRHKHKNNQIKLIAYNACVLNAANCFIYSCVLYNDYLFFAIDFCKCFLLSLGYKHSLFIFIIVLHHVQCS